MDGRVAQDGWIEKKRRQESVLFFLCVYFSLFFLCVSAKEREHVCLPVCVCVHEKERTLGGDSRYLGPADRHLAPHQPSTARPHGVLTNVTSRHRQSRAERAAATAARTKKRKNPSAGAGPVEEFHSKESVGFFLLFSLFFLLCSFPSRR